MTNQISAETLSPITHNSIPVITTELLASLYGTDAHSITKNHRSNVGRFVAGKHYFKLEGTELKAFKNKVTNSDLVDDKVTESHLVAKNARHLILWTERGAARHAKMLETEQAWEVFEKLEDFYFTKKAESISPPALSPIPPHSLKYRYAATVTIWDKLTNRKAIISGEAHILERVAEGIATDIGFAPVSVMYLEGKVQSQLMGR